MPRQKRKGLRAHIRHTWRKIEVVLSIVGAIAIVVIIGWGLQDEARRNNPTPTTVSYRH